MVEDTVSGVSGVDLDQRKGAGPDSSRTSRVFDRSSAFRTNAWLVAEPGGDASGLCDPSFTLPERGSPPRTCPSSRARSAARPARLVVDLRDGQRPHRDDRGRRSIACNLRRDPQLRRQGRRAVFVVMRQLPLLADFVAKVGYNPWMLVGRFTNGDRLWSTGPDALYATPTLRNSYSTQAAANSARLPALLVTDCLLPAPLVSGTAYCKRSLGSAFLTCLMWERAQMRARTRTSFYRLTKCKCYPALRCRAGRFGDPISFDTSLVLFTSFAGQNRLRAGRRRQVCEKRTPLISRLDFAVNSISIPVIR